MLNDYTSLLKPVLALAQQAAAAIMQVYRQPHIEVTKKADHSPVTAADLAAHDILVKGLQQLTPDIPVLSEESAALPFSERQTWQQYWLIDPVDGTSEFIERTDDFVINIAFIEQHVPVLGMIYAPVTHITYEAVRGCGAFKRTPEGMYEFIQTRACPPKMTVTLSRRHGKKTQELLHHLGDYALSLRGSALKFGLIAEGVADIYPRLGPTSEWDTAAGQCIVEEAGGCVVDFQGKPLRYNTKDSLENSSFIVMGDKNFQIPSLVL